MRRILYIFLLFGGLFLSGEQLFAEEKDYKDYTDRMLARIIPEDPATIAISNEIMQKAKEDSVYLEYIKRRIFSDPNEDMCWFLFGNFVGKDLPGKNDLIEKVLYHKSATLRAIAILYVGSNSLTEKVLPRLKEMASNDENEMVRKRALRLIKMYEKYAPHPVQKWDFKYNVQNQVEKTRIRFS